MNKRKTNHWIVCAALGVVAALPLNAQDAAPSIVNTTSSPAPAIAEEAVEFDLSFPGGALGRLVEQIKEVSPSTNVVLPLGSENIAVSSLELRNITFEELAMTLSVLLRGDRPGVSCGFTQTGRNTWTFFGTAPMIGHEAMIGITPYEEAHLCTFSLSELLQVYKIEDLVTLITTVWEVSGEKEPEKMSVHTETMMLIMMATDYQESIVLELLEKLSVASEPDRKLKDAIDTWERRMERLKITHFEELDRSAQRLKDRKAHNEALIESKEEEIRKLRERVEQITKTRKVE